MNKEFITYKLGEITNIYAGGDLPDSFSTEKTDIQTIPVYSNGEKNNGLWGYTDMPKVTEPAVTISARGSKVGFAAIRKQPFLPIVRLLTLIPSQDILDVDYLFYNLKLNRQSGIGSGQPQITIPDISNRTISIPSLYTQRKIASVLTTLDSKIELNNRINTELEAMAKTMYDYWFVQFDFPNAEGKPYKSSGGKMVWSEELKREVPEGWDVDNLLKVSNLEGGGTPNKAFDEYWNGEISFYTPSDYTNSLFVMKTESSITETGLKNCSSKLFPKGSVFITARGTVGNVSIASENMAMNQSCYAFCEKNEYGYCYLYYTVSSLINILKVKSGGSVFNSIVSNDIKHTKLPIPPENIVKEYREICDPIFSKILVNQQENLHLSSLRDWLLPMLMNGQMKVNTGYEGEAAHLMAAEPEVE